MTVRFFILSSLLLLISKVSAQNQIPNFELHEANIFAEKFLHEKDSMLTFEIENCMTVEHFSDHIVVLGCRKPMCGIIMVRPSYECSNSDRVLAYSTESLIRASSNSMKALMKYYEEVVTKSQRSETIDFRTKMKKASKLAPIVNPLLKGLELNQFNYDEDINGITYIRKASCGIVRLIQLLTYYNYPTKIPKYKCDLGHGKILQNIIPKDTIIQYDQFFKNELESITDICEGRREIKIRRKADTSALTPLAKFIATATDSEYHTGWTMTNNNGTQHILIEHLGFSRKQKYMHNAMICDMYYDILSDLKKHRPVLISGGGHGFICDGIDGQYLHMNFGWGGANNGWYRFPIKDEKLGTAFLRSYLTGVIPNK